MPYSNILPQRWGGFNEQYCGLPEHSEVRSLWSAVACHRCRFFKGFRIRKASACPSFFTVGCMAARLVQPGSAATDARQVIPGFNDAFSGEAPDLGAYELDGKMPHHGPRPTLQ